jgi:two-component system, OmpR family, sensor histidine kinase KdpD
MGLSESLAICKPLTPLQEELVAALRDEAVRMSRLVSNLLDMGRMQSGEVKLNLQWQPFEEVVGSALRASGTQLVKHQVETRLARDLPLVRFDAVLIERALCNLVENAAKYTPAGSSIILAAEMSGRFLKIVVSDNGPGLPLGKEEAVFEKFTRGERESAKPGVGLGLAICRAIVEAHAGTIHTERTPGGGASFVFTLPLGKPPDMQNMDEGTSSMTAQGDMPSVATLPSCKLNPEGANE